MFNVFYVSPFMFLKRYMYIILIKSMSFMLLMCRVFDLSYDVIVQQLQLWQVSVCFVDNSTSGAAEQPKRIWFLSHSCRPSMSASICCNHSIIHLFCSSLEVICQFQIDRLGSNSKFFSTISRIQYA